jgi:hypothetical protein
MKYLSVPEVAQRLGLSRSKAYRVIKNMVRVNIDGAIRIPEDALTSYLASRTILPWDDSTGGPRRGGATTTSEASGSGRRSRRAIARSRSSGSEPTSSVRLTQPRTVNRAG